MPIYEFQCTQCAGRFDELVRASVNLEDIICPQCGAKSPKKLMSAFGFASSGKSVASTSSGHNCGSCHSGHCSTCH
jgi:putative FmdB family regulatory protein